MSEPSHHPKDAESISRAVREIIAEHLSIAEEDAAPDKTLRELGADSLDTVEIEMELEDHFLTLMPDRAEDGDETVAQLTARLMRGLAD
jgi:acyl carrier protein